MSYAQTHYKSKRLHQSPRRILQQSRGFAMPYAKTFYKFRHSRQPHAVQRSEMLRRPNGMLFSLHNLCETRII
jgi:hypothetical protein